VAARERLLAVWWMRSHLEQGRLWFRRALTLSGPEVTSSAVCPLVLAAAGYVARIQSDFVRAITLGESALAAAWAIGDCPAGFEAQTNEAEPVWGGRKSLERCAP
jgi:hypothetical protein